MKIKTENKSNIKINNFGAIKEADIDIAPFTVFIGPNSSGKSFIAKLIQCFSLPHENSILEKGLIYSINSSKNFNETNKKLSDNFQKKFEEYLDKKPTLESDPFLIKVDEIYPLINEGILKYLSEIFEDEIKDQFDTNLDNLISFDKNSFEIIVNNNLFKKDKNKPLKLPGETFYLNENNSHDNKPPKDSILGIHFDKNNNILIRIESSVINKEESFLTIYSLIGSIFFENLLLENSYYIPAERSEIISDKKMLTRKVLNKSDLTKNQSQVFANIKNIDKSEKGDFYELGCQFENEFSGISVDIQDESLFNEIVYTDLKRNVEIPSQILSTSIHEMSIFSIYLKYLLKKDDLLIIEEPEAHLNPRNQRILVKYFVKAINKGLKILITTHSDYIINQIDNLINLNNVRKEDLTDLNYSEDDVLINEDINIYSFKINDDDTYNAEKILIEKDGFTEDAFSKITDELYDETIKIRNMSIR